MTHSVLAIHGVSKSFNGQVVLGDFDLEIAHGEFVTLLGPSGCGKTTLLRLIAGFEKPDVGSIFLDNINILPLPPEKRQVNTVFQSYALFPHMTVFASVGRSMKNPTVSTLPGLSAISTSFRALSSPASMPIICR